MENESRHKSFWSWLKLAKPSSAAPRLIASGEGSWHVKTRIVIKPFIEHSFEVVVRTGEALSRELGFVPGMQVELAVGNGEYSVFRQAIPLTVAPASKDGEEQPGFRTGLGR
jgi:hypothetical protein